MFRVFFLALMLVGFSHATNFELHCRNETFQEMIPILLLPIRTMSFELDYC